MDLVAIAVLGLCGLAGFQTIFGGSAWLVVGGVGLLVGMGIGVVGRRFHLDALTVAVATMASYFLLSGVAVPDEALAGVLPSPGTVRAAASGVVTGWSKLLTTLPPVGTTGDLLVVPLFCAVVAGVLATSAALRTNGIVRPVLALAALLAVSILFGVSEPANTVLQGAVFAVVVVAWVAARRRGTRASSVATAGWNRAVGATLMLALGGLAAVVLGNHLPGADANPRYILREQAEPPFDPLGHPSPLAGFRHFKDDQKPNLRDKTLFTVSGMPKGEPIRLAVLDSYDGVVWNVAGSPGSARAGSGVFQRVGETVPTDGSGRTVQVELTIEEYDDIWLPGAGTIAGVRFAGDRADELASSFRLNRETGTGAVPARLRKGDRVTLDVRIEKAPTPTQLAGRPAGVANEGEVTAVPEELKELAGLLTAGRSPGYDRSLAIANTFVKETGYGYSDGLDSESDSPSAAGHSARRMQTFAVDAMDKGLAFGNGEQYASAMALMARTLDIPSRVVMGFCEKGCPGNDIEVKGEDVTAWVEVNIDGYGWVAVNPTPPDDKDYVAQEPKPKPTPEDASQPPPPPVTPPPSEEITTEDLDDEDIKPPPEPSSLARAGKTIAVVAGLPLLLIALPIGVIVGLKRRRRAARRSQGSSRDRIAGGWAEVVDLASDLGRPVPRVATRREAARFLGGGSADDAANLADLAVFGPNVPIDGDVVRYWECVEATRTSLLEPLGRAERLRASINPASLLAARRARRQAAPRIRKRSLSPIDRGVPA